MDLRISSQTLIFIFLTTYGLHQLLGSFENHVTNRSWYYIFSSTGNILIDILFCLLSLTIFPVLCDRSRTYSLSNHSDTSWTSGQCVKGKHKLPYQYKHCLLFVTVHQVDSSEINLHSPTSTHTKHFHCIQSQFIPLAFSSEVSLALISSLIAFFHLFCNQPLVLVPSSILL